MDGTQAAAQRRTIPRILVVDDDPSLLAVLTELLCGEGYAVSAALTAEEALERCREETYHLVLCDLQLPGKNGMALLKILRDACPATALVLITAHGSIRSAVTALKRGACEYMTKPIKPRRLLLLCAALTADPPDFLPSKLLAADRCQEVHFDGMVARSCAMRGVFERIRLAAGADSTVLIIGESGTGKELVARSIHMRSPRQAGPFVPVHTGAIPRELIASELFGHERGSFTGAVDANAGKFEQAEDGTLFLDEISTMDERTQIGLLRVLESFRFTRVGGRKERGANVRVVAASNQDLAAMVQAGTFREDLFYRLNILTLTLPPLRERPEDIPILASTLVRAFAEKYHKPVCAIPATTERLLCAYSWPGNVRELKNVVEQAILLARGAEIEPDLLPKMLHRDGTPRDVLSISIGSTMGDIEKQVILRTLEANGGNKTAAAEVLGMSRRSIYNKLAEYQAGAKWSLEK